MDNKNINEKPQNKRLDKRRKKEIIKLLSQRYSIEKNDRLIKFVSLYIDCESIAKKYVQYYKSDRKLKNSESFETLK